MLEDIETTGPSERHGPVSVTPVDGGVETEPGGEGELEPSALITIGKPSENRLRVLEQRAGEVVNSTLEGSSAEERSDQGVIQEKIRRDLKRFINKQASRRPLILHVILEV